MEQGFAVGKSLVPMFDESLASSERIMGTTNAHRLLLQIGSDRGITSVRAASFRGRAETSRDDRRHIYIIYTYYI